MESHKPIHALTLEFLTLHEDLYKHFEANGGGALNTRTDELLISFERNFMKTMEAIGLLYDDEAEEEKLKAEDIVRNHPVFVKLLEASNINQTITKPYGYSGDFQLMEIIYENGFSGKTPFGQYYNRFTTSVSSTEGVRQRRSLLSKLILESNGPCLSVAAGPGREIEDARKAGSKAHITAIDADIDALRHFQKNYGHLENVSYEICNVFGLLKGNFKTLKPKSFYLTKSNPRTDTKGIRKFLLPFFYEVGNLKNKRFDLIYSAGLFDYIKTFKGNKTKGTIGLTRILFDLLLPGGKLVIGIMSTDMPKGQLYFMEVFCDWKIIFRSREELREFAHAIPKEEIKKMEIVEGHENIQAYLVIEKKGK